MTRPRLLDLFCGAGGCSAGYDRAGFDVTGVDKEPMPRYPFAFVQADAMEVMDTLLDGGTVGGCVLADFAAIHASPPCQDHMRQYVPKTFGTGWLLDATRQRLQASGLPWVIENVPGASMRVDIRLCGCMFGLPNLSRERWFETSWHAFDLRPSCHHPEPSVSVTGNGPGKKGEKELFGRWPVKRDWERAMGIDWMTVDELTQAIPPPYAEYVGRLLLEHLAAEAAA